MDFLSKTIQEKSKMIIEKKMIDFILNSVEEGKEVTPKDKYDKLISIYSDLSVDFTKFDAKIKNIEFTDSHIILSCISFISRMLDGSDTIVSAISICNKINPEMFINNIFEKSIRSNLTNEKSIERALLIFRSMQIPNNPIAKIELRKLISEINGKA